MSLRRIGQLSSYRRLFAVASLNQFRNQTRFLEVVTTLRTKNFNENNRQFSTEPPQVADDPSIATYEEVKDLPNHKEKMLIDVREAQELKDTGVIPTSINIPLNQVPEKLSSEFSSEEFLKLFKRDKPSRDTPIIFFCRIGVRSQNASEACRKLGYKNVKNYKGSWLDWAKREGIDK